MRQRIEHVLEQFGYRLVDDAWKKHGRRTFLNSEDADYELMKELEVALKECGFGLHETTLRAFRNSSTGQIIEIEIGGPETSGHFLHYFKSE